MRRLPPHSIWSIAEISLAAVDLILNRSVRSMEDDDRGDRRQVKLKGTPTSGPAGDAQRDGAPLWTEAGVAVIDISGVMVRGGDPYWGEAPTDLITLAMQAVHADPDVGAVVPVFNTPGGSVDGLAELYDSTLALAQDKPVLGQVAGMCCSAGYFVGSACRALYAGRMDMVGSIGTRLMLYDFSKYYEEAGVKAIPIDTGKFKSAGAPGTVITDEQIAYFQGIVDAYQKDFLASVTKGRSRVMSADQIKAAADGRVWTAPDALKMGLIDGIQTTAQTIAQARGIVAEQIRQKSLRQGIATRGKAV